MLNVARLGNIIAIMKMPWDMAWKQKIFTAAMNGLKGVWYDVFTSVDVKTQERRDKCYLKQR